MSDSVFSAMKTSAWGMRAQGERTRVISENLANANTASKVPGGDPYARKEILFKNVLDRESGVNLVKVDEIRRDPNAEFNLKYMPDHPGADDAGYVKMPNVNVLVEMNDMREAQRSYEANLSMLENSRNMASRTIDILR
jgi:flagellar basal-body rod protein FlgC